MAVLMRDDGGGEERKRVGGDTSLSSAEGSERNAARASTLVIGILTSSLNLIHDTLNIFCPLYSLIR